MATNNSNVTLTGLARRFVDDGLLELKVLEITHNYVQQLPEQIGLLTNLKAAH